MRLIPLAMLVSLGGAAQPQLSKIQYWWDQAKSSAQVQRFSTSQSLQNWLGNVQVPTRGLHVLHLKAQNASGVWGPEFQFALFADSQQVLAGARVQNTGIKLWWDGEQSSSQTLYSTPGASMAAISAWVHQFAPKTAGHHRLSLAALDAYGNEGIPFQSSLWIDPQNALAVQLPSLQRLRLVWNGDTAHAQQWLSPGRLQDLQNLQLNAPGTSYQKLQVQAQNGQGQWSPLFQTGIYVDPAAPLGAILPQLQELQYWWNQDSSHAQTQILAQNSAWDLRNLQLSPPASGYQSLNVRVKNNQIWGPVQRTGIYVDPQSSLQAWRTDLQRLRLWWDSDSLSSQLLAAQSGDFSRALSQWSQSQPSLSMGLHRLNMQVESGNGVWGPIFRTQIQVDAGVPVWFAAGLKMTQIEAFCGADPGAGNARSLSVLSQGAPQWTQLQFPVDLLKTGSNSCALRVKDADHWGDLYRFSLNLEGNARPLLDSISGPRRWCSLDVLPELSYKIYSSKPEGARWTWLSDSGDVTANIGDSARVLWNAGHGVLRAYGQNSLGLSDTARLQFQVDSAQQPVVQVDGNWFRTLNSGAELSYEWQKWQNNSYQSLSAQGANYHPSTSGRYRLALKNGSCPAQYSQDLDFNYHPEAQIVQTLGAVNRPKNFLDTLRWDLDQYFALSSGTLSYQLSGLSKARAQVRGNQLELSRAVDSSGLDTLWVRAYSAPGVWVEQALQVQIRDQNRAPQLERSIADLELQEDFSSASLDLSQLWSDADGDSLVQSFEWSPQVLNSSTQGQQLMLSSIRDRFGVDTLYLWARDPAGLTSRDTVLLKVHAVNDAPVRILGQGSLSLRKDFVGTRTLNYGSVFKDADLDSLQLQVRGAHHVQAQMADSILTLTALSGAVGLDSLIVRASDGNLAVEDTLWLRIVDKQPQSISLGSIADQRLGNTAVTVSAQASSSLAVRLLVRTPNICQLQGSQLQLLAAGRCTVWAEQDGDTLWNSAPRDSVSFAVQKKTQTISFARPADQNLSQGAVLLSAQASSNLALEWSSLSPQICTVQQGIVQLLQSGECHVLAAQSGDAEYAPAADQDQKFMILPSQLVGIWQRILPGESLRVYRLDGKVLNEQKILLGRDLRAYLQELSPGVYWIESASGKMQWVQP